MYEVALCVYEVFGLVDCFLLFCIVHQMRLGKIKRDLSMLFMLNCNEGGNPKCAHILLGACSLNIINID